MSQGARGFTGFSETSLALVLASLPLEGGRTPRELAASIDTLSLKSIRLALWALAKDGRVAFSGEPCARRYRQASP
jgi:hypothetical protein